jgi:hypothetical protein
MAVNQDNIRKALDSFEEDKYTDAKDILSREISNAKNDFLKNKLGLKGSIDTSMENGEE